MSDNEETIDLDEIIQQTDEIAQKLKDFKKYAKQLVKKEEKKKREPVKKEGVVKLRKIKEDAVLYHEGLNFYQYKENAVSAGYQNPREIRLKDLIIDFNSEKPKKKKERKNKKDINI